jgi:uncharacterized protein (DUF924 family)
MDKAMTPEYVLDFWFGAHGSPERGKSRAMWFKKDDAFDVSLHAKFGTLHTEARAGRLQAWEGQPKSALALIIVLDQFSRNMFRGKPESFAGDAAALRLARAVIARGQDTSLLPVMRQFLYLPFEHSENLADQDESVRLFTLLDALAETKGLLEWAEKHRAIVQRFGRFPHRNAILGRESTAEEMAFLTTPGSSF